MVGISKSSSAEERILGAATAEFAAHGYFGARTQAIADAAGVNKAMLHYYFRSKENLYGHVIKAAFARILTQVGEAWLHKGPLKTRLQGVVDSYMDNYERNPGFLKIILREVVDGGERFRSIFKEMREKDFLSAEWTPMDLMARVAEELGLSPRETVHLLVNLIGMCVISFTSPPLLESLLSFDVSDFQAFLRERRVAIKSMMLAYVATIMDRSIKE
jgi:TetR/AcrR family transcriptional regulator